VKYLEGVPEGVRSHSCRAAELFRETARRAGSEGEYLGFRLASLVSTSEAICRQGWPDPSPLLWPESGTGIHP
jgi:hypothetical protein